MKKSAGRERGATLALVAVSIAGLLSIVALAVDIGLVLNARTEAQRAADAAALAGAGATINYAGPDTVAQATSAAIEFGEQNDIMNQAVDLEAEDVEVDLAQGIVRVTVHRDDVRGGPVATWFAQLFGIDLVNISAVAAAQVQQGGGARCVKPFGVYDKFHDVNGNGEWDEGIDYYDATDTGYGSAFRNPPGVEGPGDMDGTGWDGSSNIENDFGLTITLKGRDKNDDSPCCPGTGPSYYYEWAMPAWGDGGGRGGDAYRDNIQYCNPNLIEIGTSYFVEPGGKTGPTVQGIEGMIGDDTTTWDQVINGAVTERIVIVPAFSPARVFHGGRQEIVFTNFLQMYVVGVYKDPDTKEQIVEGKVMGVAGAAGGTEEGPQDFFVRLIE